jgi:acetyl-CoA carboxylase carboxyl transferase subunit beta
MAWFKNTRKPITSASAEKPSRVPEGLWVKCPGCVQLIYKKDLEQSLNVCPKCTHHFRINATERLTALFDDGEFVEYFPDLISTDPLRFTDTKPYRDRLHKTMASTGLKDAVIVASGRLDGIDLVIAAMEYSFIGGSMGVVVGEKITRAIEMALERRQPAIVISCSGGARMMEGALSLMQMAKVSAALARLDRARLPFISILTDPTTGGVTASFAMLGDLNIAEPKALIGFAGPRVIEQTIRQKLPEGFQRSEFLVEHGMIDLVVDRRDMKATIARALRFMGGTAVAVPPEEPVPVAVGVPARHQPARRRVARAPVSPRDVRPQARAREHLDAVRRARPSRAQLPIHSHRRHQRQGLGHGDGARGVARRGHPRGTLYLATPHRSLGTFCHPRCASR